MTLDKIDLYEARAAFLAVWMPNYATVCPDELEGDYEYCLERLLDGSARNQNSISSLMLAAVLAAREWHRELAEKAKEVRGE